MRYFDLTLTPTGGGIHPADARLAGVPAVEREALLHVDAFADGTGVLLYRLHGDPAAARDCVDGHEDVLDWDVLPIADGGAFHLYVHVAAGEPAGTLLSLSDQFALIVDTPIGFTQRGGLLVTLVGTHDTLRGALESVPHDVHVTIRQVGRYSPGNRDMLSLLTTRQREVFEQAVESGYYEIPRRLNQSELAERLGCAPSTVDEHLRKAESKLLSGLVDSPQSDTHRGDRD
ncbi:helix-turn-helix domain-containing protein [Salinirubellus salinus]|uniref:Helix-turn-helix domain-containing protein n=1 Tax=Salinirubellus salinus TaxID=1364945 RepID=A0A9E7R5J4_9EURY|nr:helix-turn-helix domain-containing protein [Salinirubellus salinus]UWM55118.1 helix-turn-helix domain-containing protein [Salinirubellus salinus]